MKDLKLALWKNDFKSHTHFYQILEKLDIDKSKWEKVSMILLYLTNDIVETFDKDLNNV